MSAKFIKLTRAHEYKNTKVFWINADHIDVICPDVRGAEVALASISDEGGCIVVMETPEQIFELIKRFAVAA